MHTAIFAIEQLEVRALADGAPVVAGYAVVFDQWSLPMTDGRGRQFKERISPTALDRTLASNRDIRALWNHNMDYPLGRTANGTLQLRKDAQGLRFELRPDPDTFWGASAVAAIKRGDVSGMSFAFQVPDKQGDTWSKPELDGLAQRTLLDLDLLEVSPVTFPAYPQTSAQVRAVVPDFATDGQEADAINEDGTGAHRAVVAGLLHEQNEILRRR